MGVQLEKFITTVQCTSADFILPLFIPLLLSQVTLGGFGKEYHQTGSSPTISKQMSGLCSVQGDPLHSTTALSTPELHSHG